MYCLHFLQGGTFRETTSNKKIETIDDFNGLKIRTMENKNHMAFWQAMGAAPTASMAGGIYFLAAGIG